jgi:hypothetical protein
MTKIKLIQVQVGIIQVDIMPPRKSPVLKAHGPNCLLPHASLAASASDSSDETDSDSSDETDHDQDISFILSSQEDVLM